MAHDNTLASTESTSSRFRSPLPTWTAIGFVLLLAILALRHEGRRWWCAAGDWAVGSLGIHSPHTSQHWLDPNSLTHVLHGVLLYALIWAVARRWSRPTRLVLAAFLEASWEVVENSAWIIDRYRGATVATGYEGDSVANSLGDIASCLVGFVLAGRLPVWWSVVLFLVIDGGLLMVYRDNLALNLLMLVHPIDAIRAWQAGGH